MTGTGKRQSRNRHPPLDPGEEIVISGISGRFPKSRNVAELNDNLMKKKDLVTKDGQRWQIEHVELPGRHGITSDIDKFDSIYFGFPFKQVICMDPMGRMLLEHVYEAIVDAGVNPKKLRGTKTAVIVGACHSESELFWYYNDKQDSDHAILGNSKSMAANRVSSWLGLRGPSYSVDTACSSSMYAIDQAFHLMKTGECNAAIVAGINLCLHPCITMQFYRLGVLSLDGRCKCFDDSANGYVRSETICALYLQKAKEAKRVYATIVHSKTNSDGYKEQGITFPSAKVQRMLLEEFYEECGIPPTILSYMEAHATGTRVGDPEELDAINKALCNGRITPLKIGAIKSNLGHSEPASGLCAIAKVIIAMETGIIPPNINLERLRTGVECLNKEMVQVITEPTPWELGYAGLNSFGFGGANSHLLLKSNPKEKRNGGKPIDDIPRLVTVSGRTEEAISSLFTSVETMPLNIEYIRLLHEIHAENISGHQYRGYMIVGPNQSKSSIKEIVHLPDLKKPVCFIFSGLGSQWPGMAKGLMKFSIFSKAVHACSAALNDHNINVVNIITNKDKKIFDNIINSFVGIAAVQIGLVDLLKAMGVIPDYIIGYSFGELACAYADGCITAKQMIRSAYYMALACTETETIRGAMATIALGYEKVKDLAPPDIDVACHDGPEYCTICGPEESVKSFTAKLRANMTFTKVVSHGNNIYHSRYAAPLGQRLLTYLAEVIPVSKKQSEKWLSTSTPRSEWGMPLTNMCSAEYHVNNLLNTVLFDETIKLIPKDAVVIEIAPHGVLQLVLKESLHTNTTNIALAQHNSMDNIGYFLQALGKLYNSGLEFQVANIYPAIEFPVSRGTPMISPHIRWDHSASWFVTDYMTERALVDREHTVEIEISDEYYEYMVGHVIDGRVLLPATGYLFLVWDLFSRMQAVLYSKESIIFEDVKFERATHIPKEGVLILSITIQKGTGAFEIIEGGMLVVSGKIRDTVNSFEEMIPPEYLFEIDDAELLTERDIYKELRLRGYEYSGLFRGLKSASITGSKGRLAWQNNWASFMDTMLQISLLGTDSRALFVPTGIEKLIIDSTLHHQILCNMPAGDTAFPVYYYNQYNIIKSGGIEMHGVQTSAITRRKTAFKPVLEEYRFKAYRDKDEVSLELMVILSAHLAIENNMVINIKVMEMIDDADVVTDEELLSPMFIKAFDDLPLIQANAILVTNSGRPRDLFSSDIKIIEKEKIPTDGSICIICGYNLLSAQKAHTLIQILRALKRHGFILTRESVVDNERMSWLQKHKFDIILEKKYSTETLLLLKKRENLPDRIEIVQVDNNSFEWLEKLKEILKEVTETKKSGDMRILLVGESEPECGILGLANCLRAEPGGELVRTFVIQDETAPKFSVQTPIYAKQLELDMAVNILRPGFVWGSYRHVPLAPPSSKPVHHAYISQTVRADLNSFRWVQGPIRPDSKEHNLVYITHAALNFRDVMLATGKLALEIVIKNRRDLDASIGFEYSGVTPAGRRVMGILKNKCLSNMCIADKVFTWEIPDHLTLEDAATIPCTYSTCCYALYISGNMKKGDKVLIHAGTGGIGQAAINLALHEGCEVFTTVGTPHKRKFIRETFPSIDDEHIGNSRDTSFEQMILERTNGRGVDIVLNSLAEEKLKASVRCLASGGRFLEIGKFDLAANNYIKMETFLKGISFHGVMLDNLINGPDNEKRQLNKYIMNCLKNNAVKPLTRKCFARGEVETAFRYMAGAKHMGKVLIKIHDDGEDFTAPILAYPRYHCLPNRSYVIFGGLGGLGLEVADWLVLRGAQIMILISRGGIKNGYQEYRINTWKSYGVKVLIISGVDASSHEGCEFILKTAENEAPVDGVFNLAALLKDNLCVNQTVGDFEDSVRPKAWITKRLDELSRTICPSLRHFVIFSSVSCGRGTPGQTNYGLGNSAMERICEKRAKEGLPALAIQWGAVGEVGLVADMQDNDKELIIGGTLQQKVSSCLDELDKFLMQDKIIVSSMVVAEKRAATMNATTAYDALLHIMGLEDLTGISTQTSLAEMGMDSMMAVEVKQTLERDFEIFLTPQDIRNLTFAKIMELSVKSSVKDTHSSEKFLQRDDGMKLLLPTLGTSVSKPEICVELVVKESNTNNPMFFIPGVEGYATVFSTLTQNLKHPATCLQMGVNDADNIEDLVKYFLPHVLERSKARKDFVIVGYSFGSIIGIELARALEVRNFTGKLVLIDGSPNFAKKLKENIVPSTVPGEFEVKLITTIRNFLYPGYTADIVSELMKCKTWEDKLDILLTNVPPEVLRLSVANAKAVFTAFYKRLMCVEKYDISKLSPLRSPITLLKATIPSIQNVEPDYGLKKITSGELKVYEINGDHLTILDNKILAAVINGDHIEDL